jgi:hypothetical protein
VQDNAVEGIEIPTGGPAEISVDEIEVVESEVVVLRTRILRVPGVSPVGRMQDEVYASTNCTAL